MKYNDQIPFLLSSSNYCCFLCRWVYHCHATCNLGSPVGPWSVGHAIDKTHFPGRCTDSVSWKTAAQLSLQRWLTL